MKKARWLLTFVGMVIILDSIIVVIRSNIHLGVVLTFALGVILLSAGIFRESLKNRLDAVVDYCQENPEVTIIVSGGQGPQETITEALAMERYLLEQGVREEQIVKEQMATSTRENFLYSKEILDRRFDGAYKVAFITSDYHIYRANLIAKSVGFEEIAYLGSDTPWYQILPSGIRECLAVVKQWLLPQK